MESFRRILTHIVASEVHLDIIKRLPVEIASKIFGLLDNRTLRIVSEVSAAWRANSEYERTRRRQTRRVNNKRQPQTCIDRRILTLSLNGRSGIVTRIEPGRLGRQIGSPNENRKINTSNKKGVCSMRF